MFSVFVSIWDNVEVTISNKLRQAKKKKVIKKYKRGKKQIITNCSLQK